MSVTSGSRRSLHSSGAFNKSFSATNKKVIRFQLPHNTRVKDILNKYLSGENIREYEQLVCSIRDHVFEDEEIFSLLEEATQCISLLNRDLRLFVEAVLSLKWTEKSERVVDEYQSFLINLLCAHNYHTKFAIDKLVTQFKDETDEEWQDGNPSEADCIKFSNIHSVINVLLKVIPMCKDILYQSLISNYPYIKKSAHCHETYIHNILWILDYHPEFKVDLLLLLFNRLILLDSNAPKEEIIAEQNNSDEVFEMDDDEVTDKLKHPLAHTLDVCLDKVFNYITVECYDLETNLLNWDRTKSLYQIMIIIFDKVILPTYNIHHVQFSMFYLCSFKLTLCEAFISRLWKKFCDPNEPSIHRQSAVGYIASLLARGAFVPLSMLKSTLEEMANWIHKYILTQDGLECVNSDVRVHSVFYSICQALFYVVAFKHRDLVKTKKNITFLGSLNLVNIVTCRLNPLRVCQPAVLQNFAAVTRTYQLAYCYSIIERNQRNIIPTVYLDEKGSTVTKSAVLDAFFPFDPYVLKRCASKLNPIYVEYQNETETKKPSMEMEDDDFINDSSQTDTSKRFSYGTSPGFKFKS